MNGRISRAACTIAVLAFASWIAGCAEESAPEPPPADAPASPSEGAKPTKPQTTPVLVRVLRADGTPAAGARVVTARSGRTRAWGRFDAIGPAEDLPEPRAATRTDTSGAAILELGSGAAVWVSASLDDEAMTLELRRARLPDSDGPVVLHLRPSRRIRGEVVDSGGTRIPNALVHGVVLDTLATFHSSVGPFAWRIDPVRCADATFEFAGVVPRGLRDGEGLDIPPQIEVQTTAPGFLRGRHFADTRGPAPDAPLRIVLVRTGAVRGRCVDADGRPAAGVVVHRRTPSDARFEQEDGTVRTDAEGRFVCPDFPELGGTLEIARGAFARRDVSVPSFAPGDGHDLGDIVLVRGATARGRVLTPAGDPVPGATVRVGDAQATTDDEGRFVIPSLPAGPVRIRATDQLGHRRGDLSLGNLDAPVPLIVSADGDVQVRLRFADRAETPRRPSSVRVTWRRPNASPGTVSTGKEFERLDDIWVRPPYAGRWVFGVDVPGWTAKELTVDVEAGRGTEAVFELERAKR